jgi:hypothetical protein
VTDDSTVCKFGEFGDLGCRVANVTHQKYCCIANDDSTNSNVTDNNNISNTDNSTNNDGALGKEAASLHANHQVAQQAQTVVIGCVRARLSLAILH